MAQEMITLADLCGAWRLTRRIQDYRANQIGDVTGVCDWSHDRLGLIQRERGVLRLGTAPPMQAERVYLWRADGAALVVLFEDGRPFHRLGPGQLTDRHICPPDIYDVCYDLGDWPNWTQVWRVTGPRKDLLLETRFQPLG